MHANDRYTARLCAQAIHAALEARGGEMEAARDEVLAALEPLAREPGLLDVRLPRPSAHSLEGGWLYWDGEINVFSARFPQGVEIPVHDHGTWEIVGVYEGDLEYRGYRRLDDGSHAGRADLELIEQRVLGPGEFAIVPPPPADIHGFCPRSGDMTMIGVIHGGFVDERHYFDVAAGTVVTQSQFKWKTEMGR